MREAVMGGERLYGEEMEVVSKVGFLGYCKMAQGEFFFFFSQISVAPNQNVWCSWFAVLGYMMPQGERTFLIFSHVVSL